MQPFQTTTGIVAPLNRANVDTDQIIPKQFLKRIERTGFGQFLFFDWRYEQDGKTPNPNFELNAPELQGATILLAGKNFGSGSSREHAPWALDDYGFRVILAQSFADIFYNNCFKVGILPITLPEETIDALFQQTVDQPGCSFTVDLEAQTIIDAKGSLIPFEVTPFRRECLLEGLDDIGLTLQHEGAITNFETARPAWMIGLA